MIQYLLDLVILCIVNSVNWIIEMLGALIGGIFSLLPLSPFATYESQWFGQIQFIEYLQWIIPIDAIMSLIGSFIFAVGGYYVVKWILSIIKMI